MNLQCTNPTDCTSIHSFIHFYGYPRSYDNSEGVIIFNLLFSNILLLLNNNNQKISYETVYNLTPAQVNFLRLRVLLIGNAEFSIINEQSERIK